jgi:hypothetical protein
MPCNFEVNPITHYGVISLFSSNFQNFNTFRPLFKKLLPKTGSIHQFVESGVKHHKPNPPILANKI